MKNLVLIAMLVVLQNVYAQLDTTSWYPLHVGDKWEYSGDFSSSQVEVIGDTLMPNGKSYYILTLYDRKYQRVDNNRFVMVYNEYAADSEYINYDLLAKKGDIFVHQQKHTFGYGVYERGNDDNNFLGYELEWKEYRQAYIDTSVNSIDTLWDNTVDAYWPRITKGFGVSSYAYGLENLVGAVINGVSYGTLVSVHDKTELDNKYLLEQNYPNPFNPITNIEFTIPEKEYVELNVYNSLGQLIKVVLNKIIPSGHHNLQFNGDILSSGIYFYQLKTKNYCLIRKMLLLK